MILVYLSISQKKRFKKLQKFELTKKQFKKLSIYSKKIEIYFYSIRFGECQILSNLVDVFKISSGDNNFFELIEFCARYKKPLIISTGMLAFDEIKRLLSF